MGSDITFWFPEGPSTYQCTDTLAGKIPTELSFMTAELITRLKAVNRKYRITFIDNLRRLSRMPGIKSVVFRQGFIM